MKRKIPRRFNPIAYELRSNPLFKPQRIKDPAKYTRKEKHKKQYLDIIGNNNSNILFEYE